MAYYSDETARRALQELDGNMALSLSHPIALEYLGPSDIKQAGKLQPRLLQSPA